LLGIIIFPENGKNGWTNVSNYDVFGGIAMHNFRGQRGSERNQFFRQRGIAILSGGMKWCFSSRFGQVLAMRRISKVLQ